MPAQQAPNIVFIMADQLAASFIGCYGSGVDSTPTLDALAARGARFDRFYAACPVCAPNRATILTGRSPEIHGLVTNNLVLTDLHPSYTRVMQQAGYRTGGFGKFHFAPMQRPLPADYAYLGFDESVITEDPKLGPWLDWVEREHPEHYEAALAVTWPMPWASSYGPEGRDLLTPMLAARQKLLGPRTRESGFSQIYTSPLPAELHQTTWITDRSLDFIRRHTEAHPDRPFYCQVSYVDPHDPYDPPAPYDKLFKPEDMPAPIPPPEGGHDVAALERSRDIWDFRKVSDDRETMKRMRAYYHGSVRFIDDQIARIVEHLEQTGLAENTLIMFTTDHGDMMGDHGLITKGIKHYDAGIRCPMIVAGPGVSAVASPRLSSSLDIYPTLLDLAGIEGRPPLEGRSFARAAGGREDRGWETVTVQAPHYEGERCVYSIITREGWRFSVYDGACCEGQMFDLNEDPKEEYDLFDDPSWARHRSELAERLVRAYMQRGYVQQYPALPRHDGQRWQVGDGWETKPVPEFD